MAYNGTSEGSVTTLLAFLFVLGVLIFVHELGHYLMARRQGVRVLTFSLGFGPKILNVRRGDTDYCVSIIPLGGYVKMAGENPEDPRAGQPDEFLSKTKWQRFQILIAGPAMNILLALVVTAVVLMQGTQVPAYDDQPAVIGGLVEGSPAAAAGIQRGDRILSVAGDATPTWADLVLAIGIRPEREVAITLARGAETLAVTVRTGSETQFETGTIGVQPDINPVIVSVVPGSPAEAAGLRVGDVVLAVDGMRTVMPSDLVAATADKAGVPIELTILSDGTERTVRVTPELREGRGMIGISPSVPTVDFQPSPLQAVTMSVDRTIEGSSLIFKTVGHLLSGEASPRQLMGPVAIAQLSGQSAEAGWVPLFALMSIISLNLGILNLLPIPVLDGGHILILALEGIARRDFSIRVKEKMLMAGFVLLFMLMITVIYNDLTRISWIEALMPWRN
ncbi:MAG: RIP metalloprotease RseP [Acidimicrobiia bacterium]|nr:RIP metalloprotease RseP [Acidimicrobiia bacterium]